MGELNKADSLKIYFGRDFTTNNNIQTNFFWF